MMSLISKTKLFDHGLMVTYIDEDIVNTLFFQIYLFHV